MFLSEQLFDNVLTRYIELGADEIRIVSGYASPEMCTRLLMEAKKAKRKIRIRLIIGMAGREGVSVETHERLLSVHTKPPKKSGSLSVRYVTNGLSVHSKLFIWLQAGNPLGAWMGSSNFTQNGFGIGALGARHKEILTATDAESALAYFAAVEGDSIDIADPEVRDKIPIQDPPLPTSRSVASSDGAPEPEYLRYPSVVLPLVALANQGETHRGQVHSKSGLNWGHRITTGPREPNQAYIPHPAAIRDSHFFPPKGVVFKVTTTDDELMLMRVAQQGSKGLQTPQSNSIIGRYFRRKLGVADGAPVDLIDLQRFGSRFVAFYKVDDEGEGPAYVLDYSPEYENRGSDFYEV